ncbi:MAG TPA: sulfatase, partial [Pirellulales bacterium]|nr:sulfatase [Pirellulales bacterium]
HHASDPALTNLAGKHEYAAKQAEMEALLLAEMRRLDDPYRLWNQPDDGLKPQSESIRSAKKNKRKSSANE